MKNDKYVEFQIQGFVPPYDRIRIFLNEGFTSCGTARLGMAFNVDSDGTDRWCGGVVDYKELRELRDVIDAHLKRIDELPADERRRLASGNLFSRTKQKTSE